MTNPSMSPIEPEASLPVSAAPEVSKKAAKKDAAKQEKLRRRQEAAASAAAMSSLSIVEEEDAFKHNYGDVTLSDLHSKSVAFTEVGALSESLEGRRVRVRGHAQTIRAVGKKVAFVLLRENGFTVQCVVTAKGEDEVSPQMVKYAAGLTKESIVDVEGLVSVPPLEIKGATQKKVEVQVRKLYFVSRAVPNLPFNFEDSARSESDFEKAEQVPFTGLGNQELRENFPRMAHSGRNSVVQRQKIIIPNKYGEKLVGLLHETGSKEIVILCHGHRSTKDNKALTNLASTLQNEGICAFRFDFAGNGESEGTFQFGHFRREADDLHAVVQHFCKENRVISAILGHSKGGDVVLLYGSLYHDVHAIINVSGRYDLKKGIEERLGKDFIERVKKDGFIDVLNKLGSVNFRVTEESLMDRLNTNMHEACLNIDKACRVLTIHGSGDELIPVEDALEFAKIIPNHKLEIVEGADHIYSQHQTELAAIVLSFMKEVLNKEL